jgi:hypothetical protein
MYPAIAGKSALPGAVFPPFRSSALQFAAMPSHEGMADQPYQ